MAEPGAVPGDRRLGRSFFLRRVLPLLLVVAGAVWYFRDAPRDVTLAMDLAGRREGLKALRIDVFTLPERHVARHLELYFPPPSPVPTQLRSEVRLAPGEYQVDLVFDFGSRTERVERRVVFEGQSELLLPP